MFTMAFNPNNSRLYFPKGASAVNGTFGAAVTVLDPDDEVIIPRPYWVSYPDQVRLAGGAPVIAKTSPKEAFSRSGG